ncbi:MAG TPA: GNAT family N-acetyltransferase [Candidatus Blautia merdigallinarum]|uniref:GNAT family N-acetyltransferase n=1 Tax=Candidatus Blautia merdigallinarum TaxID=2838495 RepID=A0A9D2N521_9FIRM|nr:GNAT family N-acetyltransferase [Candidatus Blautia merdigallinarum]
MISDIKLRTARTEDAEKLLEIYRPYVEKTAISFEYEVPYSGSVVKTKI